MISAPFEKKYWNEGNQICFIGDSEIKKPFLRKQTVAWKYYW